MNYIDDAIQYLNKLNGLPAGMLVLLACIVAGYALRFIKKFPNDGIPVAVILLGGLLNILLADTRVDTVSVRVWIVRNVIIGLVIGFIAWILHNQALSRLECWLVGKVPQLSGTTFFRKSPDGSVQQFPPATTPAGSTTNKT